MRGILKSALCALGLLMVWACTDKPAEPVEVGRLDIEMRDMAACDTPEVSAANLPGAMLMFRAMGYDSISPELLQWWSTGSAVKIFQPDVDSVYSDIMPLQKQLASIMASARKNGLDLPAMKFYSIVWGKPQPLLREDNVMLIALNHYLGEDYPGYSHWESYRRTGKTPEMLPYDVAAALAATQQPMSETSAPALIDWLLYEGALVEARMRLVDDADLATALGYTPDQLRWCESNYDDMMREIASRRMLYDTDPVLIDRMLAPAPASPLLANQAPGRVGRYIGYRLVRDYIKKHPSASLSDLLKLSSDNIRD